MHRSVISIDAVRQAVHFHAVIQSVGHRDNAEAPSLAAEPAFKLTQAVDFGVDARSIHLHAVLPGAELQNLQ